MKRHQRYRPAPIAQIKEPAYQMPPMRPGVGNPLEGADDPALVRLLHRTETFDYRVITAPLFGQTMTLLGPQTTASKVTETIRSGYVGEVYEIVPYLEGPTGPLVGPRIPNATYTWKITLNNRPASPYEAIDELLGAWSSSLRLPLLEIRANEAIGCTVTVNDPAMQYTFVGIRVRGLIVPLDHAVQASALRGEHP